MHEHIPLVFLVLVDEEYGRITWKMELELGRHSHTRFTNPGLVAYAESFGGAATRSRTPTNCCPYCAAPSTTTQAP